MKNTIKLEQYVHPMDASLSQRIVEFPVLKQLLKRAFEEKMDDVNYYLYNSSCIRLPSDHPAVTAFQDGARFFGIDTRTNVYIVRSYNFDVQVVGYTDPVILVSSRLVEENNAFLLRERLAVAPATIAAGHNKLDFLLWLYDNFCGLINIPILNTAMKGLICEWHRSRQYTLDRAFLLYTKNYHLAKKNVLYGTIPYSILEKFEFDRNDTYYPQVKDFYRKDNAIDIATAAMSVLEHERWLPSRYEELRVFYQGGEGVGMDM